MKTAQQIQNLKDALIWWATIPEDRVYPSLGWWAWSRNDGLKESTTDCKTIACFGGWCARVPSLIAQGVGVTDQGYPKMGGLEMGARAAEELFGDKDLFSSRGAYASDWTNRHYQRPFKGSDHEIVMRRIRHALKQR